MGTSPSLLDRYWFKNIFLTLGQLLILSGGNCCTKHRSLYLRLNGKLCISKSTMLPSNSSVFIRVEVIFWITFPFVLRNLRKHEVGTLASSEVLEEQWRLSLSSSTHMIDTVVQSCSHLLHVKAVVRMSLIDFPNLLNFVSSTYS